MAVWRDRAIEVIATRQQGLITRVQLLELGLSRSLIDKYVARGRLIAVHRGVYAVGHRSLPPLASSMAAVLAAGPEALLSHHSAASAWRLMLERDRDIDITIVDCDRSRGRRGIRVHRLNALDPRDATTLHGIPITTAPRALLDITPDLGARDLERAFDRGLKGRLFTRSAVVETVTRSPRRPGAARLAALADAESGAPGETRSLWEERLLALARAGGLPLPEINVLVGGYEVDALWRRQRLVVEVDGFEFHRTRRSFENDHARDLALAAAGFTVMRFTADQLKNEPEMVLVRVAQRLAALETQSSRRSVG